VTRLRESPLRKSRPPGRVIAILLLAARPGAVAVSPGVAESGPQAFSTATAGVSAHVVSGLSIRKTGDLEVGAVRSGSTAGSVTISATDAAAPLRTASGGISLASSGYDAARFVVTGTSLSPDRLQLSLPVQVVLSRVGGSETVVAHDFTGRFVGDCSGAGCAGAPITLLVGATLDIGADQPGGRYVGTFTVTVNES